MKTPVRGSESPYGLLRQLFPGLPPEEAGARALHKIPSGHRRFVCLPNLARTRMYLPAEPSLSANALGRARRNVSRRERVVTATVVEALRLGVTKVLRSHLDAPVTPDCIEVQLADLLQQEVRVSIFLGPPRANRKPVLQVLTTDGALLAVAKVGVNELTSSLARDEAAALRSVGERSFDTVLAPRLLGEESRNGHTMVLQSPLEVPSGPAVPERSMLRAVFNEISRSGGVSTVSLGASEYIEGLRRRVLQMTQDEVRNRAAAVLNDFTARDTSLDFGAWHGDLSPWNLAAYGSRVLVWDWERFADGVPLGFDALHYSFLPRLKDAGSPQGRAGVELLEQAGTLLLGLGVAPQAAAAVATLYLLEVATRFAGDDQVQTGILGGDVEQWLLPALRHYVARERN